MLKPVFPLLTLGWSYTLTVQTDDGIVGSIFELTEIDREKDQCKVLTPEIDCEIDRGKVLTPRN